jgi:hypothetical protein
VIVSRAHSQSVRRNACEVKSVVVASIVTFTCFCFSNPVLSVNSLSICF